MLTISLPRAACSAGINRRTILQAGGAGLLGLTVPRLARAEAAGTGPTARAKSVVFLFLFGGPSQLETFDMKPDTPSGIRGPFSPTACRSPGLLICEHLGRLAELSDKYCVIRSMTHSYNDHSGAGHYLQTGRRWHVAIGGGFNSTPRDWPSLGSVTEYHARELQTSLDRDLPSYVVLPNWLGRLELQGQYRRPGEYAGWLGQAYNPLTTRVDKKDDKDNPYWRDCTDEELAFQIEGLAAGPELEIGRLGSRRGLLEQFDAQRRSIDGSRELLTYDRFRRRALDLVTSERTRQALDLRQEPAEVRDRYGRHLFGQSCLMARRMVEAGVRFVTVHYDCCDGYSWDSHLHSNDVRDHLLPTFDQGTAALLSDLSDRGLLAETLVVAVGEMGRTPQANASWGRGHWSTLFPALMAGAGVPGGTCWGASDKDASLPVDDPTTPEDLAATLYHLLGIDPHLRLPDVTGRPTPIVEDGRVIAGLA
jgi:hypothetical protein